MPMMKLTKTNVDKIKFEGKRLDYFDTEVKGFGMRVGSDSKTFFARKEVDGKPVRCTIGKYGAWTPDLAREEAKRLLRKMDEGVDPREERKAEQEATKTVSQWFAEYRAERKLKPRTLDNIKRMEGYLKPWHDRPLGSITRAEVLERHREVTKGSGPGAANLCMAYFRAVWNFAHLHLENPPTSPTRVLSAAKEWHVIKRRKDRLPFDQFPAFFRAIETRKPQLRDGLALLVHTGMRANEVERLLKSKVNLEARTFMVEDTKNGTDLELPMSGPVYEIMKRWMEKEGSSPYLLRGKGGGMVALRCKVLDEIGFDWLRIHGLRRTFRSICESLAIPPATIKALMNHSLDADITDSYLEVPVELMRPYSERISAEIERLGRME